jgi:hypothetical protein
MSRNASIKNGLGFPWPPWETELAAEFNVVGDPFVYLTKKLIVIANGYKARPNNFYPLKVDGLDGGGSGFAIGVVPNAMD